MLTIGHLTTTRVHRHINHGTSPYWIMGMVVQGRVRLTSGGQEIWNEKGGVSISRPGAGYTVYVPAQSPAYEEYYAILSMPTQWTPLWKNWTQRSPGLYYTIPGSRRYPEVLEAWKRAYEEINSNRPAGADLARLWLMRALTICGEELRADGPAYDPRIQAALEHANLNLAQPLRVSDLARVAHLSVSCFAHLFARQVGVPPMRYLEQARIQRAQELLTRTGQPVWQVGLQSGFGNPFHFSRRFRAVTGVSPAQYRERANPQK